MVVTDRVPGPRVGPAYTIPHNNFRALEKLHIIENDADLEPYIDQRSAW